MRLFIATTLITAATAFSPVSNTPLRSPQSTTSLDASKCGTYDFDIIIVGCGVGGHGAALHSRAQDLTTAVFSGNDVGGTCVNRGCVPSKAARKVTMSDTTEEKIFLARVAEQAERFEDMVSYLGEVLDVKGGSVSADERNLLSVAFKNLISSKRAACRTISAIEQNPKYQKFGESLAAYKSTIEGQLTSDCEHIVDIIEKKVLTKECASEAEAFFVKMVGDYYRYIAENAKDAKLEEVKEKARTAYEKADGIDLAACNPIKLGLALNYSVFQYEVMKNHERACELADSALTQALEKIDELEEDDFRDAKSIIELLKENLTLWKEEEQEGVADF